MSLPQNAYAASDDENESFQWAGNGTNGVFVNGPKWLFRNGRDQDSPNQVRLTMPMTDGDGNPVTGFKFMAILHPTGEGQAVTLKAGATYLGYSTASLNEISGDGVDLSTGYERLILNYVGATIPAEPTADDSATLNSDGTWTLSHWITGASGSSASTSGAPIGQKQLGLSFRLTGQAIPTWNGFSKDDATLTLKDHEGKPQTVPAGWTASWDETTRLLSIYLPADWMIPDGATLTASIRVNSVFGEAEATSDAKWAYTNTVDGSSHELVMKPLLIGNNKVFATNMPMTGLPDDSFLIGGFMLVACGVGLTIGLIRSRA